MMKRDRPKRVTLPNRRIFLARCKRVTRDNLPANVRIRRGYRQRDVPLNRHRRPHKGVKVLVVFLNLLEKLSKIH